MDPDITTVPVFPGTAGTVEWTISGYLIGFSLGQLLWGPIGDRHGRRLPVAIGLVLFVIGSAGCALAGSIWAMIAWRAVQAMGACAGVVLARAMVRDLYEGDRAAQIMSTLMTVMAIAPLLGPILGGQILALAGWRAIFWTLVGVGLATLAALFMLPETLPAGRRGREPLLRAFAHYGELFRHRRLLGYVGVGGFFYGGMFAYIAGTPFAFITYHHVPPQLYGLLFGIGVAGIMATNFANSQLVTRLGSDRLLLWGTSAAALAGTVLAVAAWMRVDPLFEAPDPARARGASVTFEPGARTAWHTHPLGQTLIVTSGYGRVQRLGGPIEEIRPGDVVWFVPGEKHWHGAAPLTAMTHIAIVEVLDGKSADWMEKVFDEEYQA